MVSDSKLDFFRARIKDKLAIIKDDIPEIRYRLWLAFVDECNNYDELREMAELDMQISLIEYTRKEINPRLARIQDSLDRIQKSIDSNGSDYTIEDIVDDIDDPEVDAAMANMLMERLANEPLEETYREELLDSVDDNFGIDTIDNIDADGIGDLDDNTDDDDDTDSNNTDDDDEFAGITESDFGDLEEDADDDDEFAGITESDFGDLEEDIREESEDTENESDLEFDCFDESDFGDLEDADDTDDTDDTENEPDLEFDCFDESDFGDLEGDSNSTDDTENESDLEFDCFDESDFGDLEEDADDTENEPDLEFDCFDESDFGDLEDDSNSTDDEDDTNGNGGLYEEDIDGFNESDFGCLDDFGEEEDTDDNNDMFGNIDDSDFGDLEDDNSMFSSNEQDNSSFDELAHASDQLNKPNNHSNIVNTNNRKRMTSGDIFKDGSARGDKTQQMYDGICKSMLKVGSGVSNIGNKISKLPFKVNNKTTKSMFSLADNED